MLPAVRFWLEVLDPALSSPAAALALAVVVPLPISSLLEHRCCSEGRHLDVFPWVKPMRQELGT